MQPLALYEYLLLDLTDRLEVLWQHGTFIANVKTYHQGYNLYQLFDFYVDVEVFYEKERNTITAAEPFRQGHKLDKFLDQIDLNELTT